ncbi:MAG: hypothetical protein M3441_24360 [Chloroflexota bacterium]|nr:hypothetical protein [Chloroflexota bacterium]
MGLETRKGRVYYYRKERAGSRVRSVYVGGGAVARGYALLDNLDRAEAEEKREARRREREADEIAEAEIAALGVICETLTTAAMLAAGFHTHKRQWRRKRDG